MFLQVDCIVGRIKGDTKGDTKRVTEGETKLKKSSKRGIFCDVTRENLSNEQISRIEESSVFGKLINIDQVTETIFWLITDRSAGVTGQFVTIDNGFTKLRKV